MWYSIMLLGVQNFKMLLCYLVKLFMNYHQSVCLSISRDTRYLLQGCWFSLLDRPYRLLVAQLEQLSSVVTVSRRRQCNAANWQYLFNQYCINSGLNNHFSHAICFSIILISNPDVFQECPFSWRPIKNRLAILNLYVKIYRQLSGI